MWRAAVATSLLLGEDEASLRHLVPPGELAAEKRALHIGSPDRVARAQALAAVAAAVLRELEGLEVRYPLPDEVTR